MTKACVIAIGELAQCPRMQFHALSLAENKFKVTVISYKSSESHLDNHPNIDIKPIRKMTLKSLGIFSKVISWLMSFVSIAHILFSISPNIVFIQNPPAILIVPLVYLYKVLFWPNPRIVLDWHNYGYTLVDMKYHSQILTAIYKWLEMKLVHMADINLCVSKAMKHDLQKRFKAKNVHVLYDYPPKFFAQTLTSHEKHDLYLKYGLCDKTTSKNSNNGNCCVETWFTTRDGKNKLNGPALLISSTSFTEDEDFSDFVYALDEYEKFMQSNYSNPEKHTYPDLVCIITGRGPLKTYYERLLCSIKTYHYIRIKFLWLDTPDYPKMLSCAKLGVCLHNSSSGLDLPMKIQDMHGTSLPVLAYHYETLAQELIQENVNGQTFTDRHDFAIKLKNLMSNYPNNLQLHEMQTYIKANQTYWSDNWNTIVAPLIL